MSQSPIRDVSARLGRGFTLLETMLAAVLGAMVIVVALSLFSVVQRSDKRSQIKMEENLELAHAHTALARTFHMLLMSSDPRPNESETNDFLKKDDERNAADQADQEDEDATSTRVAIQPDINNPVTMVVGAEGEERRVRSQIVHLTLRDSPVLGEGDKTEEQQFMDEIMRERVLARAADRLNRRVSGKSGSSSRSENSNAAMSEAMTAVEEATGGKSGSGRSKSVSGSKSSTGKNISLRDRNKSGSGGKAGSSASEESGLSADGDRDERTASERLDDQEEERPRAPGVRGVFEILPDGVDAGGGVSQVDLRSVRLEESGAQGVQTYSLWWRELPPIEINNDNGLSVDEKDAAGADGKDAEKDKDKSKEKDKERKSSSSRSGQSAGDQIDREVQRLADASDSSGKRVRLLSGLQTCHWTAFRGRKERDKITAKYDSHLPAFVELEIVTASGRRENWIFDVAWTIGPEPGSVLAEAPDALNNGLASTGDLNGNGGTDGTDNGTNNGTGGTDGKGNGNTDGTGNGNGNPKGIGKGGKGGNNKGDGKSEQQRAIEEIQKAIRRATGGDKGGGGGK